MITEIRLAMYEEWTSNFRVLDRLQQVGLLKEIRRLREQNREFAEKLELFSRTCRFLHAHEMGDATEFVDPYDGRIIATTYEARALARACLQGPATG